MPTPAGDLTALGGVTATYTLAGFTTPTTTTGLTGGTPTAVFTATFGGAGALSLNLSIPVTKKELEQAKTQLDGTSRLFEKGFVPRTELVRDEIAQNNLLSVAPAHCVDRMRSGDAEGSVIRKSVAFASVARTERCGGEKALIALRRSTFPIAIILFSSVTNLANS